jgi:predicted Fe-S protein YdhL (DUF1289 family)
MNISSPCVNICQLDSRDVCTTCLRTRNEIARWSQMSEWERIRIMAALPARGAKGSVAAGADKMTE